MINNKMKTNKNRFRWLSLALMLITLQGWVAAQKPTPANNTTTIRYTMTAPASTNWMAKDFDDSAWTKTEDAASIPAVVPKDGEVWIRIRRELPWELINNTYAKVKGTGPVEVYVNGKQTNPQGGYPSINGWRPWPLTPHRNDQPGVNVYAFHGKGAAGFQLVHEPWVKGSYPEIKPQALIEEKLRDANVIRGGDGNYYMTGTFAGTEGDGLLFFDYKSGKNWKNNDGVKLYRSADLKNWTDLGWVWTFKNNATWCKESFKSNDPLTNGKQGIFAPKFHYLNGKYIIVYGVNFSMPNHNWGVGIAVADKPEGPYRETSPNKPICPGYDAQIFRDDDGQLYLIRNNGQLGKLKPDMSELDGPMQLISPENYPFVNFEGAALIKRGDTYYVMGAEILLRPGGGTMGCTMVASSKNIFGPYGKRYVLLSDAGGHSRPFQDENGKWWTALYTWSGFSHQFGITGIDFTADGTIYPTGEVIQPPQKVLKEVVPTSQLQGINWKYTFEQPAADWFAPGFADLTWKEGPGGFGINGTPGAVVRSEWRTADIWMRREFDWTTAKSATPVLLVHHDDDVEIYINGVLAAKASGFVSEYQQMAITPAGKAALKPGKNVLAVHCLQRKGGQYVDVGLYTESPGLTK